MAIQEDGQIVVAGNSYGPATNYESQFGVVRLNGSDGSMDTSFGGGDGSITIGPAGSGGTAAARSVAVQSDGQIVVAGYRAGPDTSNQYLAGVVRLNGSEGSLDTSFGGDGIVTFGFGSESNFASSVAMQSDGRIVVAGTSYDSGTNYQQIGVARLNGGDGSLDLSFGGDGSVTFGPSGASDSASALAIQGDGQIVIAGYAYGPATNYQTHFHVLRLNGHDGSLDPSFDADGTLTTNVGGIDSYSNAVALRSDGRIVVGGSAVTTTGNSAFAVARYHQDGALDSSFDGDGMVLTTIGRRGLPSFGSGMAVQSNGKIVMVGMLRDGSDKFVVVRFNANGSFDTSFGIGGSVTVAPAGGVYDSATAVAVQSDGQIVVAGVGYGPATNYQYKFGVVRLNGSDGSLDPRLVAATAASP